MPAAGARGSSGGGGGRSGRSSSASSRSANTGRGRSSKKNDQELLHRAAATQGWFSLSKYTDSVEKYFDDRRREDSRKVNCRVLRQVYDEWRCDSGEKHSVLVDSICEDFRKSMIEEKCDDYLMKSDQEAADTTFRSSVRKFFRDVPKTIHRRAECRRLKDLYDKCRSDLGDNHCVCQDYRKRMIKGKCNDYLKKSDQGALDSSFTSCIRKFFRDIENRMLRKVECKRLEECYDECKLRHVAHNCQDYLKLMSEKKCRGAKNGA